MKCKYCESKSVAKGVCGYHWGQLKKFGEIRRPRKMNNEYIECDNYHKIVLYNRNLKPHNFFGKISKEDYDKCKNIRWMFGGQYIKKATSKENLYLHKYILGTKDGCEIDHINRDKLDNRRENLRFVTRSENNLNRGEPDYFE